MRLLVVFLWMLIPALGATTECEKTEIVEFSHTQRSDEINNVTFDRHSSVYTFDVGGLRYEVTKPVMGWNQKPELIAGEKVEACVKDGKKATITSLQSGKVVKGRVTGTKKLP